MKLRTLAIAAALTAAPVVFATPAAFADKAPVYTGTVSNVAVEGHDAVAYFTEGKPVKGSKTFKTTYNGAEFRFATAENLATFEAEPAKYAPQYGGYCAWAVSQGNTAPIDPTAWKIVDGKLYLNYNAQIQNRWAKDIPGNIALGDQNWPGVLAN